MKKDRNYKNISLVLGSLGIFFYISLFLNISYSITFLPNLLYNLIALGIVPIGILSIVFGALRTKKKNGKTGLILGIITLILAFASMIISALKYV